jgi:hypothetical protein
MALVLKPPFLLWTLPLLIVPPYSGINSFPPVFPGSFPSEYLLTSQVKRMKHSC